jgi:hypothetical protein
MEAPFLAFIVFSIKAGKAAVRLLLDYINA